MTEAPLAEIPRFAVIGRVNKGKSSILATLVEESDNRKIRISSTPGETTQCQVIPLVLGGETLLEFIDTPGFNRARQALDWLQRKHRRHPERPRLDTLRDFVAQHQGKRKFEDECLLLTPVLDGAGILYVVDSSKPFRADFLAEMEILRWTGRPRLALLNHISAESDFSEEWRQHLGETFNLTREFNAHQARFKERIRLITSLLDIEETQHPNLQKTIIYLKREWEQRRNRATDLILDLLKDCLTYRASKLLDQASIDREYRRNEVEVELIATYCQDLQTREAKKHRALADLYRHENIEWSEEENPFERFAEDLFSEETWEVFGLDRKQLLIAGGVAGAASGGAVDLATGGHTAGLGALIGSIVGVTATVLKGRDLADIRVSSPVRGDLAAGGLSLKAGPPSNPNFPWILLDRALHQFGQIISRAHGRRDSFVIDFKELSSDGKRLGRSSQLTAADRKVLQSWFNDLLRKKAAVESGIVFETLARITEKIEDEAVRREGPTD